MKLNATRITFFIDIMTNRQHVGKLQNVDAKRIRLTVGRAVFVLLQYSFNASVIKLFFVFFFAGKQRH